VATYAIGDIQGCFRTLHRLLERIRYDPGKDRLWLVGDLVNRGPQSLEVLRWVRAQGDRVTSVLGNHDLHLLGQAFGTREPRRSDTLGAVLEAPDRQDLIEWLRGRPLLHREGSFVLVHAGLLPAWTLEEAQQLASEAEAALGGPKPRRLLETLAGAVPDWTDDLDPKDRCHVAIQALTRLRTTREGGRSIEDFSGPPEGAPEGCRPWFDLWDSQAANVTVVFGHWAALGLRIQPGFMALDTGCVWGGMLTAVRLEDSEIVQEPLADQV